MNKAIKAKKYVKMWEKYFYRKYWYKRAIFHFKRAISLDKHCATDEEILRKISKSFLYLADINDLNRQYYLIQALKYIDESIHVSCWYLKSQELKLEILEELWDEKNITQYKKKVEILKQEIKNTELDLDVFYGGKV